MNSPNKADFLPDGVYLRISEAEYFAQDALGTTDLARLWLKGAGWWWQTKRNPFYREQSTEGKIFGSASHALLLEGRDAYSSRFYVEPDKRDYVDLLETVPDMKSALESVGAPKLPYKATRDQYVEACRAYLPNRPVWDHILAKARNLHQDKTPISAEEGYFLECMYEMMLEDEIGRVVAQAAGGEHLVEVAVFWTLPDGTRLRFKFDSLLPAFVADLKTLNNYRDREVKDAIALSIGDYALDVQAAMSFEARKALYRFVEEGKVSGGSDGERAYLARFPKEAPLDLGSKAGWFFLWLFYQRPDSSGRAPLISPVIFQYGSTDHREGYRRAAAALATYRKYRADFGLEKFWRETTPVYTMSPDGRETSISYPYARKVPSPVEGEEEVLQWRGK